MPNESSGYNIDDPMSIAAWEASEHNLSKEKVVVVELRYFGETLGGPTAGEATRVALQVEQARDTGVAPEQQEVIDELVRDEQIFHTLVRNAVYDDYLSNYEHITDALSVGMTMFGGSQADVEKMAPKIVVGDELDDFLDIFISIHPVIDGKVSIGITLSTPWNADDMGLRILDRKVVALGNAYDAFAPWQPQ